uniref:Annexin n=1 Tax=Cacopsylla melanoneura TaxID=428564 RepID=A0A8D8WWY5_9HEMI
MQKLSFQKSEPTIKPTTAPFKPSEDAAALRAGMKGLGTDEKVIRNILTAKTNKQRQEIVEKYTAEIERDLIADLKSELGGNFKDLVSALMKTPVNFLCSEINRALSGLTLDSNTLTEVMVTRNNAEIKQIVQTYETLYKRPLVEHVCDVTKGDYRRLLTLILTGTREQPGKVNKEKAKELATALFKAGEGKMGTDETEFVKIFGHESYEQLALVFDAYKTEKGRTIEQALQAELSGELLDISLAIVECIHNQVTYYAKQLNKSMKGLGTDNRTLIRILVSRSEIDLGDIKKEYERLYNKTLESHVKSEASGDYQKALINIIRGNEPQPTAT